MERNVEHVRTAGEVLQDRSSRAHAAVMDLINEFATNAKEFYGEEAMDWFSQERAARGVGSNVKLFDLGDVRGTGNYSRHENLISYTKKRYLLLLWV